MSVISGRWQALAIAWHAYFAAFALALVFGERPSRRVIGILLSLPLMSVSALAWSANNPFNGVVFAVAAAATIALSPFLAGDGVSFGPLWTVLGGLALFAFGWVYPHFLETRSLVRYLFAAPAGLVPCPTLAIVIGFTFALRGLDSRAWSSVVGAMGVFYGLFGALYLDVRLDWLLVAGAAASIVGVFVITSRRTSQPG